MSKTFKQHFNSVTDAIPKRSDIPAHNLARFDHAEKREKNERESLDWFGVKGGHEEVRRLIAGGWQAGVDRMMQAFGKIDGEFQATNVKRQIVRGDHGDELDIHRVYSGDLGNAWTRRKRQRRVAPNVVTIAADLAIMWSQKPDELFWRGAAVMRLADILTEAGYAVRIVAQIYCKSSTYDGDNVEQLIPVKESSDPLDLNSVASTICLTGFFRMIGFQNIARVEGEVTEGYGKVAKNRPPELDGAIWAGDGITDVKKAQEWLEATVAAFSNQYQEAA